MPGKEQTNKAITPKNDLITTEAKNLKSEILKKINNGETKITIDTKNIEMIDSTGIGILLAAYNTVKEKEGSISIINLSDDLYELFSTMQLQKYFTIKGRNK